MYKSYKILQVNSLLDSIAVSSIKVNFNGCASYRFEPRQDDDSKPAFLPTRCHRPAKESVSFADFAPSVCIEVVVFSPVVHSVDQEE